VKMLMTVACVSFAALAVVADYIPEPQPVKSDIEIHALYYPGTECRHEWDMVEQVTPEVKPILGWYDEGDPWNVDWQIKWAVEHGITAFSVCWYWNRGVQRLDHWVKAYYRARYRKYLKWYVMYANHNAPGTHSTADQIAVTKFWIDNYFKTPEYYTIDGKPVVVYCSSWWNLDCDFINEAKAKGEDLKRGEGARRAMEISERLAREAGLKGIYWVNMRWLRQDFDFAPEIADFVRRAGFNSEVSYNLGGRTPYRMSPELLSEKDRPRYVPYSLMEAAAIKIANGETEVAGVPFWPMITTGYDDTDRSFQRAWVVHGFNPCAFRGTCEKIRGICERRGLKRVMVSPINEWQEGSHIELNEEFGFAMYDALRDVFCKRPADGWPENVTPKSLKMPLHEFPPMYYSPVQSWEFAAGREGWYRQPFGTPKVEWADGKLKFVTVRSDQFHIRQRMVPFVASKYKSFLVRMRIVPNGVIKEGKETNRMRLTWGTREDPIIGLYHAVDFDRQVASCPVNADGEWHEYELKLSDNAFWKGDVNELWFEAINRSHAEVEIDRMKFL